MKGCVVCTAIPSIDTWVNMVVDQIDQVHQRTRDQMIIKRCRVTNLFELSS